MPKFNKPVWQDKSFIPRVGDELEWGLMQNTETLKFNPNCGRWRLIDKSDNDRWQFENVNDPNNYKELVCSVNIKNCNNTSTFLWYPLSRKSCVVISER